jgi:hypothetical protein
VWTRLQKPDVQHRRRYHQTSRAVYTKAQGISNFRIVWIAESGPFVLHLINHTKHMMLNPATPGAVIGHLPQYRQTLRAVPSDRLLQQRAW